MMRFNGISPVMWKALVKNIFQNSLVGHRNIYVPYFTLNEWNSDVPGGEFLFPGLLIFTTELFPEIQYSRNLFEHWSPPLSVIQDVYSKVSLG